MSFLQRLRDVLGIETAYDDDYDYEEEAEPLAYDGEPGSTELRSRPNNVIGLPGLGHMEVVLMQPRSFQEIPEAVNALRQRKSVILDLTLMETDQAQRCADYVAGGAFAIDGHQRHLGSCIFLFTPSSVTISSYAETVASAQPGRSQSATAQPVISQPIASQPITAQPRTAQPPIASPSIIQRSSSPVQRTYPNIENDN
jgi:cell division inhibitor SepF